MGTLLIRNATVVLPNALLANCSIFCENTTIKWLKPDNETMKIHADEVLDAQGNYIAPGFIDMHIHGAQYYLVDKGKEHVEKLCKILPRYGVTGFLPTVCPLPTEEEDLKLISSISKVISEGTSILGLFFEGHFLAITGAINTIPKDGPGKERVKKIVEAAKPYAAVFGISPELDGAEDLIGEMTKNKEPVFMTHTAANVNQTERAIKMGASHATHFYDVFPYPPEKDLGVRACGAVEAIMADPQVSVDFILDGEHVDPIAVKMALACKGHDKVCLITDANMNAGLPPGIYNGVQDLEVEVSYEGAPARCTEKCAYPKSLAGSGLTMDRAVRNAIRFLGIDVPLAIKMASSNPARVLGLLDRKGLIRAGHDADLVMLDKELNVLKCWVNGKCCFTQ